MKDQNNIDVDEGKKDKWNRGLDIFIESVIKPDPSLRQCAHNQRCYHELMDVRQDVLNYLKSKRCTNVITIQHFSCCNIMGTSSTVE